MPPINPNPSTGFNYGRTLSGGYDYGARSGNPNNPYNNPTPRIRRAPGTRSIGPHRYQPPPRIPKQQVSSDPPSHIPPKTPGAGTNSPPSAAAPPKAISPKPTPVPPSLPGTTQPPSIPRQLRPAPPVVGAAAGGIGLGALGLGVLSLGIIVAAVGFPTRTAKSDLSSRPIKKRVPAPEQQLSAPPPQPPFKGGQCLGISYRIRARVIAYVADGVNGCILYFSGIAKGPINFDLVNYFGPGKGWSGGYEMPPLTIVNRQGLPTGNIAWDRYDPDQKSIGVGGPGVGQHATVKSVDVVSVVPVDPNFIDNCGDPPLLQSSNNSNPSGQYQYDNVASSPLNKPPPAAFPNRANPNISNSNSKPPSQPSPPGFTNNSSSTSRKPDIFNLPGTEPVTIQFAGSPPLTFPPPGDPFTIKSPNNSSDISPNTNLPQAFTLGSPGAVPTTLISPSSGLVTIDIPGYQPITIDPTGNTKPKGVTPDLLDPHFFKPNPLKPNPITANPDPFNTKKTSTTVAPSSTPEDKKIKEITDLLSNNPSVKDIGIGLVGITSLLQGISKNTKPQAIKDAAAAGTCSTLQPGGCMAPLNQNAATAANTAQSNNGALKGLDLTAQAKILANTEETLVRVGPRIPGGLSGGMSRLSKWLGIDRIFNMINFLANLHNAFMLSANLKITLLEFLSSAGNATGLLETSEGENVDLNSTFDKGVSMFLEKVLGTDNYATLVATLKKYNPIYRAATNSLNATAQMLNSLGNGIEVVAEHTGKVGNALKAAKQVPDNAYRWFSEKINVKQAKFLRFETSVGNTTQILDALTEISENIVEGQQSYTEMQEANTEFLKQLKELQKNPNLEAENKAVQEEAKKIKQNSTKDPTGEPEKGLLSFLTDM